MRGSFSVTTIKMMEEYGWEGILFFILIIYTEYTKGYILSSYFWGYIIPQTIGGVVATQYGAAYLFEIVFHF